MLWLSNLALILPYTGIMVNILGLSFLFSSLCVEDCKIRELRSLSYHGDEDLPSPLPLFFADYKSVINRSELSKHTE